MSRIKRLEEFESVNEGALDWLGGLFSKALPYLGSGVASTVKQKIAESLMAKIGVLPNSNLSVLIQEFVDAIPIADIPGIISGEKATPEYFAPKLADFVQEFVQRKGLDGIVTGWGVDPKGWLYSIIREMIQDQLGKQKLTEFFLWLFGKGDTLKGIGAESLQNLPTETKEKFSTELEKVAGKNYSQNRTANKEEKGFLDRIFVDK
jgi:hypothetical protein